MNGTTAPFAICLLAATLVASASASASSLRLEQLAPGSSTVVLGGSDIAPCDLPLPKALEGGGRDLWLRVDTVSRLDCEAGEASEAPAFDLHDFVEGTIDGEGLHRVFLVDAADVDRRLGMNFIDLGERSAWVPESGQWWPERGVADAGPGTGLFMEIQSGAISLFFATYDEDGRASWLMAAGRLEGRIFRGDLLRFSGGQPLFGEYRAPGTADRVAGIELAFFSPSRAEMWLQHEADEGVRLQMVPLTRFLFGHPTDARAWLGEWTVTETGLSGLPGRLHFNRIFDFEGGKLLVDAKGHFELACDAQHGMHDTLPQRCTLYRLDSGQAVAEFNGNGLNTLVGRDSGGHPVSLSRD